MNGSSELSDALNPNYFYGRQGASHHNAPAHVSSAPDSHRDELQSGSAAPSHIPNRSELENAVNAPAASPRPRTNVAVEHTQADPLRLLSTLMKSLKGYKDAVEDERRRRIAWEKAQESKCLERHIELQDRLNTMQEEVIALKSTVQMLQESAAAAVDNAGQSTNPNLPAQVSYHPEFERGSSGESLARKRPRSCSPFGDEDEPAKSRNRIESRPQTIHAAMRSHLLSCLDLQSDKVLPPSCEEDASISDAEPVRFIWDQTTKKSPHNTRMKARVISDLLARRDQYPLVSDKEFTKEKLDGVFEQAFTTFRQKYVGQMGGEDSVRAREEKARRSRRANRKKTKLSNRMGVRKKIGEVSHNTFDTAFQIECISSEESAEDEGAMGLHLDDDGHEKNKVLFIRYLAWRSTRLHHLYELVDRREEQERSTKPKRGVGRIPRRLGRPKDGLPPTGTPRWMISKRWIRETITSNPHLGKILEDIVKPDDDEDVWQVVSSVLGAESDDEQAQQLPVYHDIQMTQVHSEQYQDPYYMNTQHPHTWSGNVEGYMDYNQNGPGVQHYSSAN